MATSLDDIQPLELSSIRDEVRERPPWSTRATGAIVLAVAFVCFVPLLLSLREATPREALRRTNQSMILQS